MTTSAISQFIGSVLAEEAGGVKPTVDRPKVARPSAYDDTRMDISDRFRPARDYTDPASYSTSTRDDDPTGPGAYRGSLNVTGIGRSVADQFVGAPRGLSAAMAPVGLSTVMGLGAAASLKNLQRIEGNQQAGKVGNAVGMLNGRIIGVSPSPFGGYVLSGVLPPNLTHDQRKQIINQLLDMNPTTQLVGGKLPTKDDPNPPPPTATSTVVGKINQGIDPEAAGFEAGLVSGTLGGTGTGRTDAYVGQGGGTPPVATGVGMGGKGTIVSRTPLRVSPSYFGDITPAAPTSNFERDPGFLDALTNPSKYNEDLIDSSGPYGTVNDPTATASLTTTTDASPPPPSQDDSDDDDNRPSGTSYSIGAGAPVDAFNERVNRPDPSPPPSDDSDDDDGGGKIVCTAMNQAYGFGSFRQAIWLAHSRNMAPEYQAGYHAIFQPLVAYGYGGTTKTRKFVRGILEGIARRRTADIWMQKKGKRHPVGRIERAFWEPVCYAVGRIVLCLKK